MKSNRWWIRGCSLRVLKRYLPKSKFRLSYADMKTSSLVFWDGCAFRISDWEDMLNEVRALKPGDRIFNPYRKTWQTITEIKFVWDTGSHPASRKKLSRIFDLVSRYQYIGGFIICDDTHACIYDTPSDMAYRYSDYHQPIR